MTRHPSTRLPLTNAQRRQLILEAEAVAFVAGVVIGGVIVALLLVVFQ